MKANDSDGRLLGYARVSTPEQRLDLQLDALKQAGVSETNIFIDKMSGGSMARPGLNRLMKFLEPGDTVVVWRLDRLARSTKDLIHRMETFKKRDIKFRSLNEDINTSTASGALIFHVLAALAEFERNITRERIKSGMKSAKDRGSKVGAQFKLKGAAASFAEKQYKKGVSAPDIVRQLKSRYRLEISSRTIYHRFKRATG
jgi:DNA invertase Pin-like site-specific DNA recombinase